MQEALLDKHSDADLRIYAVWFSMYPTDRRENWPSDVLTDPRVVHWWDEGKVIGRWYMEQIADMQAARAPASAGYAGDILWDAFMVYGPDAKWDAAPTDLRKWGRTILGTSDDLKAEFERVVRNGKTSP